MTRPSSFAANKTANNERTVGGFRTDGLESYNGALWCLRSCATCGTSFQPKYKTNRFCGYACYSESLRHPIEPRFWSHVNKNGPIHPVLGTRCWLWTASVLGHGSKHRPLNSRHGQFTYTINQRQYHVFAHRFAWTLARGPIPDGQQVLHRCDVPPCVRDEHLFLGTQDDNMKDAAAKNRLTVPRDRTLTLFERLTIYHTEEYRGVCVDLAKQHGVTKACISIIRSGRFLGSGVWSGTKDSGAEVERVVRIRESA